MIRLLKWLWYHLSGKAFDEMMMKELFGLTQEYTATVNALLPTCKYVVGIRKNKTGEVRFCPQFMEWSDSSLARWNSDNLSSERKRHRMFHGQAGKFHKHDVTCGDYSIVGIWFHDGRIIRNLEHVNDDR